MSDQPTPQPRPTAATPAPQAAPVTSPAPATPPTTPPANNQVNLSNPSRNTLERIKKFLPIIVISFLVTAGLVVGLMLSNQSQDNRSDAATDPVTGESCEWCAGANQCPQAPEADNVAICNGGSCCLGYNAPNSGGGGGGGGGGTGGGGGGTSGCFPNVQKSPGDPCNPVACGENACDGAGPYQCLACAPITNNGGQYFCHNPEDGGDTFFTYCGGLTGNVGHCGGCVDDNQCADGLVCHDPDPNTDGDKKCVNNGENANAVCGGGGGQNGESCSECLDNEDCNNGLSCQRVGGTSQFVCLGSGQTYENTCGGVGGPPTDLEDCTPCTRGEQCRGGFCNQTPTGFFCKSSASDTDSCSIVINPSPSNFGTCNDSTGCCTLTQAGADAGCFISRYECPSGGLPCNEPVSGQTTSIPGNAICLDKNFCGSTQVDIRCPGYNPKYTENVNTTCTPPPPPPPPSTKQCNESCSTNNECSTNYCDPTSNKCRLENNPTSPTCSPPQNATYTCTGLTQNVTNPQIGDQVSFTCQGSVTVANQSDLSYEFRYQVDGGAYIPIPSRDANPTKSRNITISQYGSYTAQCRVCLNGSCTQWGQAGT